MKAAALSLLLLLPAGDAAAGQVADFIQSAHAAAAPSQVAADEAIDTLRAFVEDDKDQRLGLPLDTQRLQRGAALPVFEVHLDTLSGYHFSTDDPSALRTLSPFARVVYFVKAPLPVSSVEVIKPENEDWTTFRLGQPHYTALLTGALKTLDLDPEKAIIVEIPALQLRFLGFARQTANQETLMLASVIGAPEHGIVKAAARPANEVLQSLVAAANRHNRLPT